MRRFLERWQMAKSARGLPSDFSLELPDDGPVLIGDFLDEAPLPLPAARKPQRTVQSPPVSLPERAFRPEIVRSAAGESSPEPVKRSASRPNVIRCQLNLTPQSKRMLEEVVKHVR